VVAGAFAVASVLETVVGSLGGQDVALSPIGDIDNSVLFSLPTDIGWREEQQHPRHLSSNSDYPEHITPPPAAALAATTISPDQLLDLRLTPFTTGFAEGDPFDHHHLSSLHTGLHEGVHCDVHAELRAELTAELIFFGSHSPTISNDTVALTFDQLEPFLESSSPVPMSTEGLVQPDLQSLQESPGPVEVPDTDTRLPTAPPPVSESGVTRRTKAAATPKSRATSSVAKHAAAAVAATTNPRPGAKKATKRRKRPDGSPNAVLDTKLRSLFSVEQMQADSIEWNAMLAPHTLSKAEIDRLGLLRRRAKSCLYAEKSRNKQLTQLQRVERDNATLVEENTGLLAEIHVMRERLALLSSATVPDLDDLVIGH
jgi:hypothetical protein